MYLFILLQEWVPVINQDIVRQRRQAPQAPLSDAYLTGMPTKRLKVSTKSQLNCTRQTSWRGTVK